MASSVTHDREQLRFKNTYLFGKYSMSYWPCDELETVALLFAVAKICIPGAGLLNLYVFWVFEGVLRDKTRNPAWCCHMGKTPREKAIIKPYKLLAQDVTAASLVMGAPRLASMEMGAEAGFPVPADARIHF
ncbi:hypothetical protein CISG_01461 [Coccidioides immitis RMSCC 3703]|uniref:Uncharacterized protein n=1 Tax=Coccidioides immitis RMSCC 3703 TaxID=454286 RepID=A0A0J8R068_COCIT|nr:hypothetical protein CISG_01461 [Coccidioides immitis RMSCC 3703]